MQPCAHLGSQLAIFQRPEEQQLYYLTHSLSRRERGGCHLTHSASLSHQEREECLSLGERPRRVRVRGTYAATLPVDRQHAQSPDPVA
jgi:hypothetical protein